MFHSNAGENPKPYLTHYVGEDDLEALYIPDTIDGEKVGGVEWAAIPKTVEIISVPRGCHVRQGQEEERKHLTIETYK